MGFLCSRSLYFLWKVGVDSLIFWANGQDKYPFKNMHRRKVTLLKYASLEGSVLYYKGLHQENLFTFTGALFALGEG